MGLLGHYHEYYPTLFDGIIFRDMVNSRKNEVVESKIVEYSRKGNAAFHSFEPELPTWAYFLDIDGKVFYIGFDYNCKVECQISEMANFIDQIKLEVDIQNQDYLSELSDQSTSSHNKKLE